MGGLNSGTPTKALGGGGGNTEVHLMVFFIPGGGLAGVFTNCEGFPALQAKYKAPQVYLVAAGGGGAGFTQPNSRGGAGGGQTGNVGGATEAA